jgi:phosphoribosylglycinamide formyltransferase-1
MMYRIAVMVSGNGSNLQALIDNVHRNARVDAQIVMVICSKDDAPALERARAADIRAEVVTLESRGGDRERRDGEVVRLLRLVAPDLVVMAGWMSIVTPVLLDAFPDKVINLHPSLLPAFPGMDSIADAMDWGAKVTGVTVHIAEEAVDGGPPILQEPVPILPDDTLDTLKERVHGVEHRILTRAVTLFAQGRVHRDPTRLRRMIVNDGGS